MSDDQSISEDEDLSEYCFMTINNIESDLQCPFNKLYNDYVLITRKNKEIKKILESLKKKKDRLTREIDFLANQNLKLKKKNQVLHKNLINEKKALNNFVGGINKLNNMLFLQQSPSYILGFGSKNHKGKFNEPSMLC